MSRVDTAIRVRLTRLGWHFMFVGMFAMIGGAIRGFNLPLVLAGLITGAMLMHWRLGRGTIDAIDCRRRLPSEAFAGQPFSVRFLITNHNAWLPALLLRIDDDIEAPGDMHDSGAKTATNLFAALFRRETTASVASCGLGRLSPRRTAVAKYDCTAMRRGRYELGPSVVSTGMPIGLMTIRRTIADIQSIYVFPQLLPLRRDWRRHLQSRSGGTATTARRSGASDGDFFGLRSWQAGDSRRWIHWRTTARIGEPAVRQFEQQRRFDLCVLVDAYWPSNGSSKHDLRGATASDALERVISAAASLVTQLVPTPNNRVALAVAGAKTTVVAGTGSREQLTSMLRLLADAVAVDEPALIETVDKVFRTVGNPQDLVVVSPRTMPPEAERMSAILRGRCSLRWYSVADHSIDLLVEKATPYESATMDRERVNHASS